MLDESMRTAILKLREQGHGSRKIAAALNISRGAVRDVVICGSSVVPILNRTEQYTAYREEILDLYHRCKGNLVRVHEELSAKGAKLSYQALTSFCRRHEIGKPPKEPAGTYEFSVAQEMQHDTSPHKAKIAGVLKSVQTASLVLCYSRMIFIQLYPCFTRFECKIFLTDALRYFGGAAGRCMIDNTHVVVLKGTGAKMVPVPEMAAFAERFHFKFMSHEVGDANRSARVEGPFNFVDNNFLAGREFKDFTDLNEQAVVWCDKVNATYSDKLHASRRELFAAERSALSPLPIFIPEVYVLHQRIVDAEGYVTVRCNRYSVPYKMIGRQVEVRENKQNIEVYDGPRVLARHLRMVDEVNQRLTDPKHRPARGEARNICCRQVEEEEQLLHLEPLLALYVEALKKHSAGRGIKNLRHLLRFLREYPRLPLLEAVQTAGQYGMFDLDRLERMILKQIANDYFVLPDEELANPPGENKGEQK